MSSRRSTELIALLSSSIRDVVFVGGPGGQLNPNQYRDFSSLVRRKFDPQIRLHLATIRPKVQSHAREDELLAFLSDELAEFTEDGRLHSAWFALAGGPGRGVTVGAVLENLLRLTAIDGADKAASSLYRYLDDGIANYSIYHLLPTIRISQPTELLAGIELIPLPVDENDLPPHLPLIDVLPEESGRIGARHLVGRTVMRLNYSVSPVFRRPGSGGTTERWPNDLFTIQPAGQLEEIDIDVLLDALSIASRRGTSPCMTWTALNDFEVFQLGAIWGIGGGGYSTRGDGWEQEEPVVVESGQLEAVEALYRGLKTLPEDERAKLRIPIDRWMKSWEQSDPVDQLIDLGIALETLYVPDAQGETSFRLSLHGAWHLGETAEERGRVRSHLKEVYAARSDAVHAGKFRGKRDKAGFDPKSLVDQAQELCWLGITKVIDKGEFPDWDSLVVAG